MTVRTNDFDAREPMQLPTHAPSRWAVTALATPVLLASLGAGIANVALPTLARAFDASFQSVQWIVLGYLLATTTLIVSAGRLADLLGRRRLLIGGLALFTGASILCSVAPSLWMLVAARAAQGLGAAVMTTVTMALVGDTAPGAQAGRAMGVLASMSAVGTALGPSLGGLLIAWAGWRGLFAFIAPLGVLALVLVSRFIPRDRTADSATRAPFDVTGTLLLVGTLGAWSLAMTTGRGHFGSLEVLLLSLAVLGTILFARTQARSASPLVRLSLLRGGALGPQLLTSVTSSAVVMATLVVGPFYLARGLGLSPAVVGAVLSAGPLVSAFAGVPAGHLADRLGARVATLAGLVVMAAGALVLSLPPVWPGIPGYVMPIGIITAGYSLVQTANNAGVMMGVVRQERGVVAALLGLSRNLGLITGASAMGAVFALAAGGRDVAVSTPAMVATGMHVTFAVAAGFVVVTLLIVMRGNAVRVAGGMAGASLALVIAGAPAADAQQSPSVPAPSLSPASPYPAAATGWGPTVGTGRYVSRWAEDWRAARDAGRAPALKALPLGAMGWLTLSAEARLRYDAHARAQLHRGNDFRQVLFRGVAGADVRAGEALRLYAEVGTGRVDGRRAASTPNFQNDASLQQFFGEARTRQGDLLVGAMLGRQEFSDGPRQLVSMSDGPNLHRTWNGTRLYAHGRRLRAGAFDLRVTRQGRGDFDESVDAAERIRGANASVVLVHGKEATNVYLDALWIHSRHPALRSGGILGADERHSSAARLWGKRGVFAFDWTFVKQDGRHAGRDVEAWGLFVVQGVDIRAPRWKPRVELRVDIASDGGRDSSVVRSFHPLYASSAYLGEGQFLALTNLVMVTPGVSFAPTRSSRFSVEYGVAQRFDPHEPVRAGGGRSYDTTRDVPARYTGGLLRVSGSRTAGQALTVFLTHEQLVAGGALRAAGLPSASYSHLGATLRY